MNIKRAKDEIKNTIKAYLTKDSHGEYEIPSMRQRPVLCVLCNPSKRHRMLIFGASERNFKRWTKKHETNIWRNRENKVCLFGRSVD